MIRLDRFDLRDGAVLVASTDGTKRKETVHLEGLQSFLSLRYATGNGSTDLVFRLDGRSVLAPVGPLAIKAEARVRGDRDPLHARRPAAGRNGPGARRRRQSTSRSRRRAGRDRHSPNGAGRLRLGPAAGRRTGATRRDPEAGPVARDPGPGVDGQGRAGRQRTSSSSTPDSRSKTWRERARRRRS